MDIADQLLQIGIFLANDRLISVLKEMAMTAVPPVIGYAVACQQSPHELRNTAGAAAEKEVSMVAHQGPCVAACLCFWKEMSKAFDKILPIIIGCEDAFTFDPAYDDVLEYPGAVEAC